MPPQPLDASAVQTRARKTAFKGHFAVDEYILSIKRFDGGWSEDFKREMFVSGSAVVVILYDPRADAVALVEQFRLAPYVGGRPCWMLEYVAGKIDPQDTADSAARRETVEESGCDILRLERICEYYVSPGSSDELVTLFVAQIDSSTVGGVFGLAEEHEDIKVSVMPADEIIAMADEGKLLNMNTYLGTLWLARHRETLRARWTAEAGA